jgi:hypothetical protein
MSKWRNACRSKGPKRGHTQAVTSLQLSQRCPVSRHCCLCQFHHIFSIDSEFCASSPGLVVRCFSPVKAPLYHALERLPSLCTHTYWPRSDQDFGRRTYGRTLLVGNAARHPHVFSDYIDNNSPKAAILRSVDHGRDQVTRECNINCPSHRLRYSPHRRPRRHHRAQ